MTGASPIAYTRSAVRAALESSGTVEAAAASLQVDPSTLGLLALKHRLGSLFRRVERKIEGPIPNPLFVNMAGEKLFAGELTVLERRANAGSQAQWLCRFDACGHTAIYIGAILRYRQKKGEQIRCGECHRTAATRPRGRPPGPMRRRASGALKAKAPTGPKADHKAARSFAENVIRTATKPSPINLATAYLELVEHQAKALVTIDAALAETQPAPTICSFSEPSHDGTTFRCDRPAEGTGLCAAHAWMGGTS